MKNKSKYRIFWDRMCSFMSGWKNIEDMEDRQLMAALQFAAKQESDAGRVVAALLTEYEKRRGKMDAETLPERLGL